MFDDDELDAFEAIEIRRRIMKRATDRRRRERQAQERAQSLLATACKADERAIERGWLGAWFLRRWASRWRAIAGRILRRGYITNGDVYDANRFIRWPRIPGVEE